MVTFSSAIKSFYSRYADFDGRASRSQYWWVALYTYVIGGAFFYAASAGHTLSWLWYLPLSVFSLINIIPIISLTVRRLHDSGRGGGWIFISLLPCIGELWLLILMLIASEGPNRFGDPTDYTEAE